MQTKNMIEKKQKNKWFSYIVDGILSGVMIGIGGIVNLSCENRYMGAFLFSLGLFSIIHFQYGLYTGKVGYILDRDLPYLGETFVTLLANVIGAACTAGLIHLTRIAAEVSVNGMDVTLMDRALDSMQTKMNDPLLSSFVLAFFCGILMFTAVEGSRKSRKSNNAIAGLFVVVMPIMVFILCGFNHCIADVFYYFLAGCPLPPRAIVYLFIVILGNMVGGICIPFAKRFSNNPL